jgi:hypothetical protein
MLDKLKDDFLNPASEFTPVPFWFWNDYLDKGEIIRQINMFKEKGVDGFVIHPRIGIPRDIEYLSDEFLEYVEIAVEEASRLNMTVFLYDEAMYPSGSAHGKVVEGNPEFASRGLKITEYSCCGKIEMNIDIEFGEGENLVSAQAVLKISQNEIDPDSITVLDAKDGKIKFTPPWEGKWSVLLFIETFTGGKIRGIHFGEDSHEAGALPSADLLNPDAVRKFIKLTHERYYEKLGKYFGKTIKAVFTDEPSIMGRNAALGLIPWTRGFLQWYLEQGNLETYLPLLWFNGGEETAFTRKMFNRAVSLRLAISYYRPISEWCAKHNIALAGHPHASDEIGTLKYFHVPGQDLVLRLVAPEGGKALEGRDSTMAKCSSDAARHTGKRRNSNECFGCCVTHKPGQGWNLPAGDMKWYMDWLFVRGVNLLIPHAFYYSVRSKRAYERPPDVGPNNIWWPYYNTISNYIKRMSWLMTGSVNAAEIAVLCEEDYLSWEIVKPLYENQIEFNYLEDNLFISPACKIDNGRICIENQSYRILVVDINRLIKNNILRENKLIENEGEIRKSRTERNAIKRSKNPITDMKIALENRIKGFIGNGGIVIAYRTGDAGDAAIACDTSNALYYTICNTACNTICNTMYNTTCNITCNSVHDNTVYSSVYSRVYNDACHEQGCIYIINDITKLVNLLDKFIKRDVILSPSNHDLRVSHVVKDKVHFYLLVNEGEGNITGELKTSITGRVEKWDAWDGKCSDFAAHEETEAGELKIPLFLRRRESLILCIDASQPPCILPKGNEETTGTNGEEAEKLLKETWLKEISITKNRMEIIEQMKQVKISNKWDIRINGAGINETKINGSFMYTSWTKWPGMEDYWGTVCYTNEFEMHGEELSGTTSVMLDLGEVHEIAKVYINNREAGIKMWSPYIFDITGLVKKGINTLQVEVTNSIANKMDKSRLPSGLLGPISIIYYNRKKH